MNEREQSQLSEGQYYLEATLANIETIDDLDLSFMITVMSGFELSDAIRKIGKAYQEHTGKKLETDLVFNISDPNIKKHWREEIGFLRYLKTLKEGNSKIKFNKIIVKGPVGTIDIEPNVFASGITFQKIE